MVCELPVCNKSWQSIIPDETDSWFFLMQLLIGAYLIAHSN